MATEKPAKLKLTKLEWLSSCDFPAQGEGGAALLLKRNADEFSLKAKVSKLSDELGLVFGYAFASSMDGGKTPHVDYQNDAIDPDFLKVVTEFVEAGGRTDVNHDFEKDGKIVYAWPLLPEINKAMGISSDVIGLAVAVKPSPETYKRFKDGELTGFSIAGEGARQPLEKARKTTSRVEKASLFTDEVDGHAHKICVYDDGSLYVEWATMLGATQGHSHGIVRGEDGTLTILADSGHTHELAAGQPGLVVVPADAIVVVSDSAVAMRAPTTNRLTLDRDAIESTLSAQGRNVAHMSNTDTQIADLTKRLERAERIVKMTGAHKTYFDTLAGDDAEAFLAKTAADREAVIKAAADADPIEVEFDGQQYRKSAGAHVVALAKAAKAERERNEAHEIEKQATAHLGHLKGAADVHAFIVKALLATKNTEMIAKAFETLDGANAVMKGRTVAPGSDGATFDASASETPYEALKKGLVAFCKANNIDKVWSVGLEKFKATPEGAALNRAHNEALIGG